MSDLVVSTSVSDVMAMADVVVKSGLFPAFRTRESAAALMLLCRAKGLDPMTAIERYHVVQGRPVMRADAMLGEFVRMGGKVEWHQRDDQEARATFSHPLGGTVTVSWTMEQATAAKLTGKEVWRQYPRQMLHARCVSEGVRSVLPGATNGLYTPEEAANMDPVPAIAAEIPAKSRQDAHTREIVLPPVINPIAPETARTNELLVDVQMAFADTALQRGHDVMGTRGKPSRSKLLAVARETAEWFGVDFDETDPDAWQALTVRLLEQGTGDDTAEVTDPFADETE